MLLLQSGPLDTAAKLVRLYIFGIDTAARLVRLYIFGMKFILFGNFGMKMV